MVPLKYAPFEGASKQRLIHRRRNTEVKVDSPTTELPVAEVSGFRRSQPSQDWLTPLWQCAWDTSLLEAFAIRQNIMEMFFK